MVRQGRREYRRESERAVFPRFAEEARKANQAVIDLLNQIVQRKKRKSCTNRTGLVARAETLDRSDSGNDEDPSLEENIGSASVELTSDDLGEIDAAASKIPIQGERLPESILRMSYR